MVIDVPFGEQPKYEDLRAGDMWFVTGKTAEELVAMRLTAQYFKDNSSRHPLMLALPSRRGGIFRFLVDGKCYSGERGYYDGWTVTGHAPFISVMPSVNVEGAYHGFIGVNGVQPGHVGPDLDAR